jgi:hypothetical protein
MRLLHASGESVTFTAGINHTQLCDYMQER